MVYSEYVISNLGIVIYCGSDNNPCSGNPHDRDSGSSGNPHDKENGNIENGNPHDNGGRRGEADTCPGSK